MEQVKLEVQTRKNTGKESNKKLRAEGLVPAVIYGKDGKAASLQVKSKDIVKALNTEAGRNVILNLEVKNNGNGENLLAMVSEIQKDIFQRNIIHVDFLKISLDEKITTKIRIILTGEAPGVKEGGVLDHLLWEVEIETLPLQIPESIEVDISGLKIGNSIHVSDITPPEGVTILEEPTEMVVVVHPPRVVEEVVAAPLPGALPTAPAEPEVIARGKGEKEEEEKEGKEKK